MEPVNPNRFVAEIVVSDSRRRSAYTNNIILLKVMRSKKEVIGYGA